MSRIAIAICLAVFAAGCEFPEDSASRQALIHEENSKPVVALVPLIDSSMSELPWDLSDELTKAIQERLQIKEKLHLIQEQQVRSLTKKLTPQNQPFATDLDWVKFFFPHEEFVVFVELIEHEEIPVASQKVSSPKDSAYDLNMTARIRVVDIRNDQPRIVLQELVHDTHFIPKRFSRYNYDQVVWGGENYHLSPLGIAHGALSKEIAKRIEDYILLANNP